MKVSKYKDMLSTVGRYASTRAKNGPTSAIGVQSDGSVLKLISGTETAGMIVSVPEDYTVDGRFAYYVNVKELMDSSDVLSTKDTVSIAATKDGLSVTASGGGVLVVPARGSIKDVGFPAKPKGEVEAECDVRGNLWGQISRIIPDVATKIERPSIHTGGSTLHLSIVAPGLRSRYASIALPARSKGDASLVTELDWYEGLRALSANGSIKVFEHGVIATDGLNECYSTILQREFKWPVLGFNRVATNVWFTMERAKLSAALRGQAAKDEYERVTMRVERGMVHFSPFSQEGSLSVPCETGNLGTKSLNAGYLKKTLAAMVDSKHVTLEWGDSPGINVSAGEYGEWTLLIAHVALG